MGFENIFKKIADASATGGGNNIRDGIYKLLVEKCSIQNGHSGVCFVAEFRVMESASNGATDEQGRPIVPNPVGSTCSMVANLTKHESAAGNIKAFLKGALGGLGYTEDQIDDALIAEVVSEQNPLRGVAVRDETYRGVNKGRANAANAGKPLTLNKWFSIEQTEDEIAANAAYLDKNAAKADTTTPPATSVARTETKVESTPAATQTAPAKGKLLGALKR